MSEKRKMRQKFVRSKAELARLPETPTTAADLASRQGVDPGARELLVRVERLEKRVSRLESQKRYQREYMARKRAEAKE